MTLRAIFIKNLKNFRKEKKISQMALAEKCGTSTSYIGEIEIGKKFPSVEMLEKIADALNVPPFKFFIKEIDENFENFSQNAREKLIKNLQQSVADIVNNA